MTGLVAASGNTNSLLDNGDGSTIVGIPASYCFTRLFYQQTALTKAPELPATNLNQYCYTNMFNGCTNLETAPELPAMALAIRCYVDMFYNCSSLTAAPNLPATTVVNYCYYRMFYGCTNMVTGPDIYQSNTLSNSYHCVNMFYNCKALRYIKFVNYTGQITSQAGFNGWVQGVTSTSDAVIYYKGPTTTRSTSGIPNGWTLITSW